MSIFDFQTSPLTVSPQFWLYWALTLPLTLSGVVLWGVWLRYKAQRQELEEKRIEQLFAPKKTSPDGAREPGPGLGRDHHPVEHELPPTFWPATTSRTDSSFEATSPKPHSIWRTRPLARSVGYGRSSLLYENITPFVLPDPPANNLAALTRLKLKRRTTYEPPLPPRVLASDSQIVRESSKTGYLSNARLPESLYEDAWGPGSLSK